MKRIFIIYILLAVLSCKNCLSQDTLSVKSISPKYLKQIKGSSLKYENRIDDYTQKTLKRLSRHEQKIKTKLEKIDPDAATRLFDGGLKRLQEQYNQRVFSHTSPSGFLDTTQVTLRFLNEKDNLNKDEIQDALQQIQGLQGKLEMTEKVKSYFADRIIQLGELSKYKELSGRGNPDNGQILCGGCNVEKH